MFLLLLLLVVVEERLRALRGEVRREGARALTALGTPGLAAAVLDVESPRLLADVLAPLAHGGVQAHPRHPLVVVAELLVLFRDHRFETGLVYRAGIGQGGAHPVAHLPVEPALGEVLAAQLPVLRRMLQPLHDREAMLAHQLVVRRLHAALVPGLAVVERTVVRECLPGPAVVVDHQDVVVGLTPATVRMRHHEAVRIRVHLFREQVSKIVHLLHVLRVLRVELLIAEALPVVEGFDIALRVLRERAGTRRERTRAARHVARDRDPALVLLSPDVVVADDLHALLVGASALEVPARDDVGHRLAARLDGVERGADGSRVLGVSPGAQTAGPRGSVRRGSGTSPARARSAAGRRARRAGATDSPRASGPGR
ncbi:hypothetical protein RN04_00780 [Arthrobacter sp. W1]|nr:hypothetical protein RN04_00780 [Arthrobacter sp. W1]